MQTRQVLKLIRVEKKLEVIPGATHLFEEPGKLEEAAELAILVVKVIPVVRVQ